MCFEIARVLARVGVESGSLPLVFLHFSSPKEESEQGSGAKS